MTRNSHGDEYLPDLSTPAAPAEKPEPKVWRCFHCDETFADESGAELHFGRSLLQAPACQIDVAEYRRMEETNRRHCEEDTELHREIHRVEFDKAEAVRRAEEAGYARGLADAKKYPEELGLRPIDMVLHCPACGKQHIDAVERGWDAPAHARGEFWKNPLHRSHLCRPQDGGCGHIWRPADVPTNGVAAVKTKGKADSPVAAPQSGIEAFVVRHYVADERPTIKGNGFDGLAVGEDRQEADAFIEWLNARLRTASQATEQPKVWTDAHLRGIASDYFPRSEDWPAAMLCMRHLLMEQGKAQPADRAQRDELPPLPEPAVTSYQIDSVMRSHELHTYTAGQMRERDAMWEERLRAALQRKGG